jgi:hypothetical protein
MAAGTVGEASARRRCPAAPRSLMRWMRPALRATADVGARMPAASRCRPGGGPATSLRGRLRLRGRRAGQSGLGVAASMSWRRQCCSAAASHQSVHRRMGQRRCLRARWRGASPDRAGVGRLHTPLLHAHSERLHEVSVTSSSTALRLASVSIAGQGRGRAMPGQSDQSNRSLPVASWAARPRRDPAPGQPRVGCQRRQRRDARRRGGSNSPATASGQRVPDLEGVAVHAQRHGTRHSERARYHAGWPLGRHRGEPPVELAPQGHGGVATRTARSRPASAPPAWRTPARDAPRTAPTRARPPRRPSAAPGRWCHLLPRVGRRAPSRRHLRRPAGRAGGVPRFGACAAGGPGPSRRTAVRPGSRHAKHRLGRKIVAQVLDHRERVGVGPVQILEQDDQRAGLGQSAQQAQDRFATHGRRMVPLTISARGRNDRAKRGQPRSQFGVRGEPAISQCLEQRFGQRPVRRTGAARYGPAGNHCHPVSPGLISCVAGQAGLANPRLASQEYEATRATLAARQRRPQRAGSGPAPPRPGAALLAPCQCALSRVPGPRGRDVGDIPWGYRGNP